MLRMDQAALSALSGLSLPTIKRIEKEPGLISANTKTAQAIQQALEAAGVIFIPENGEGAGVRLAKPKPVQTDIEDFTGQ